MNGCHYQHGRNNVCIVLSAPGRAEADIGRPAAGQTGKTLQIALQKLHERYPEQFVSDKIEDYRITNSVSKPIYHALSEKTEAKVSEIKNTQNIQRLQSELEGVDVVLALGDKAQLAIEAAGYTGEVLKASHPSFTALNAMFKSDKVTPQERTLDRIDQWVDSIIYDS